MRAVLGAAIALFVLYLMDQTFNYGRFSDPAILMLREIRRSFGF